MRCNFYLDRPYNPNLDNETIKKEKRRAKERNKKLATKYFNPKPTSVYIFFSPDKNTRIKHRTSIKVLAKNWDFTNSRVKASATGSLDLNVKLDKMSSNIIREAYIAQDKDNFLSKNDYKKLLIDKVDENQLEANSSKLEFLIKEFKKHKRLSWTNGTMKEYNTVFKSLVEFQEKEKKKFSLLDFKKDFYTDFETYLSKKKNPTNPEHGLLNDTIHKYISTLRVFLKWCHSEGHQVHPYTFENHKSAFKRKAYNDIVVLTLDEIEKLEKLDLRHNPSYERVRDLFLFMIYTGQRFSDVINFSKSDFKDNKWIFISIKVKKQVTVPFNGFIANGLRILEKYDYKLPKISNQKFNEYIKEVGILAEIKSSVRITRYSGLKKIVIEKPKHKFMKSHMGRRTTVTILLSKGIPIPLIQKLTQHSDIRTLMKYNSTNMDSLINALNNN